MTTTAAARLRLLLLLLVPLVAAPAQRPEPREAVREVRDVLGL